MAKTSYLNRAQQRVLRTLAVLIERGESGALPGEIANTIGTLPSNTTRDLANLRHVGFARTADSRWYAVFPQVASRRRRKFPIAPSETV